MDFLKDNKFILALILILGFALRLWDLNSPTGLWGSELGCSICAFHYPFDFFESLKSNCLAPLHCAYLKLWSTIFKNLPFAFKLSSLIPNILGCFVMYLVGKNYQTKKHSIQIGLSCALISAISSFLIFFSQEAKLYSMVFLLSGLVLLYSIKMFEYPSKKHFSWLCVFSILLILEHTIGFVYVLFNIFGLIAFYKRKKKETDFYMPLIAGLMLCLPLIPFLFRMFLHPTYVSQWWSPFNWSNLFFIVTDFFSPVLKNITTNPVNFYSQIIENNSINAGFLLFALVPSLICLVLIIKSNIEAKRINKFFLCTLVSSFLTILIAAIIGKLAYLTKYYVELYPILILMASIGWAQLNSKNSKVALATIYIFASLFFIIVTRVAEIHLLG